MWTTVVVDFAVYFRFFESFLISFFFLSEVFRVSIIWNSLLGGMVSIFSTGTLVRFPKGITRSRGIDSPGNGFTFCASVLNFYNCPSYFKLNYFFLYFIFSKGGLFWHGRHNFNENLGSLPKENHQKSRNWCS